MIEITLIVTVGALSCVWLSSWHASVLVGLVLIVRALAGRWLSVRTKHLLWTVVLLRLVIPAFPESPFSIFNLTPEAVTGTQHNPVTQSYAPEPAIPIAGAQGVGSGVAAGLPAGIAAPLPENSTEGIGESGNVAERRTMSELSSSTVAVELQRNPERRVNPLTTVLEYSSVVWLSVALMMAVRLLIGWSRMSTRLRSACEVTDPLILSLFKRCKRDARVSRDVTLFVVGNDLSPAVTGILRPRLLIPRQVLQNLSTEELRFVLLHELVHVRRHDVAIKWLSAVVRVVHWFNPVVWFAMRRLDFERELSCDADVLATAGASSAADYGHTTIKLLGLSTAQMPALDGVGILDRRSDVLRRIEMIGQFQPSSRLQRVVSTIVLLAICCFGLTDATSSDEGPGQKKHRDDNTSSRTDSSDSQTDESSDGINVQPDWPSAESQFEDITRVSGLPFVDSDSSGTSLLPDVLGGSASFADLDSDGDLDVVCVTPPRLVDGKLVEGTLRLYSNDGQGTFQDVTPDAPLFKDIYGITIAAADYDNDGRVDLYVLSAGPNRLYRNLGKGRFEDVTERTGVAGDENVLSAGGGWFDFDNDGDLDLFVTGYARRRPDEFTFEVQSTTGARVSLFRNDGNGRFTDVTRRAGLSSAVAPSLGISLADLNNDGLLDIYVANNTAPNFQFRNRGNGTFEDIALRSGTAVDAVGRGASSTGIDAAILNDGSIGVAVGSSAAGESPTLYVGQDPVFLDVTRNRGLSSFVSPDASMGVGFLDCDLDGWLDLMIANGAVHETGPAEPSPRLEMFLQIDSAGATIRHTQESDESTSGTAFSPRGMAFGDIDNDGAPDLLMSGAGSAVRLFRNRGTPKNHWLRFKLIGSTTNRDAIGSRITIELESGRKQHRQVMPTRGFLAQSELTVTFGLGNEDTVRKVRIRWTDGSTSELVDVAADQTVVVTQVKTFTPSSGQLVQIEVDAGQEVRQGGLLSEITAADDAAEKKVKESSVRVDLYANADGSLRSIAFDGEDLGNGETAWDALNRTMREWAESPDRSDVHRREVEIDADITLRHTLVTRAISACTGRMNPDTGKFERYIGKVKFAAPNASRRLVINVGFVRDRNGNTLRKEPVVFWDDKLVPVERFGGHLADWLKTQSMPVSAITMTLRADSDVAEEHVLSLLDQARKLKLIRFALSTINSTKAGQTPEPLHAVIYLKTISAEAAAKVIYEVYRDRKDPIIAVDERANCVIISTGNRRILETVERLLKELDTTPAAAIETPRKPEVESPVK